METSEDGATLLLTMNDSCDPVNGLYYFDLRGFDGKDVGTIGGWVGGMWFGFGMGWADQGRKYVSTNPLP